MNKVLSLFLGLVFVLLSFLGVVVFLIFGRVSALEERVSSLEKGSVFSLFPADSSGGIGVEVGKEEVGRGEEIDLSGVYAYVDEKIEGVECLCEGGGTTYVTQQVPSGGTDYISMDSVFSTTSSDWVDVSASETYIDLVNDYSEDASVVFSAFLKVAHGNGKAFVRLYDATNNIAVSGSELTTENNSDYVQVASSNLPFWRGRNLYKMQIKSLNSFEVTVSGGKLKISY